MKEINELWRERADKDKLTAEQLEAIKKIFDPIDPGDSKRIHPAR
jgi:hypothetical protein